MNKNEGVNVFFHRLIKATSKTWTWTLDRTLKNLNPEKRRP